MTTKAPLPVRRPARLVVSVAAALAALTCLTGFKPDLRSGQSIMELYEKTHRLKSRVELMTMVTVDREGNVTQREALRLTKVDEDGTQKSLLRFTGKDPSVRGVALLSIQPRGQEAEQYFYLPALGQTKRVVGKGKRDYFLGTDFAFEDLLREDPANFEYDRLLIKELDGERCYNVMAYPAEIEDEENTNYASRVLWVTRSDFRILKVELYDDNDQLIKALSFGDFERVGPFAKSKHPKTAKMTHFQRKTESVIRTTRSAFNQPLNDSYFTVEKLAGWSAADEQAVLAMVK